MGEGEVGFSLGPVGAKEAGTLGVVTASDGEGQPGDAVEGRDGAEVVVIGMSAVLTLGAVERDGSQGQGPVRLRTRSLAHQRSPRRDSYPLSTSLAPVKFASLEKNALRGVRTRFSHLLRPT